MTSFGTQTITRTLNAKALAVAIATFSMSQQLAYAAPAGGVVVGGNGAITQTGADTRVDQTSERLSLQWNSFNVGANERVQFVQPGSDAVALNRILDNNGSQILGRIDANGHVVLVNPNGVFFGQGATINVGGLVASGLEIDSDDFMNGELAFAGIDGTSGAVINRGVITAATGGNIALLGKSVTNSGLISAQLGHVALAAGAEAVVTFDDAGLIGVRIDRETLATEVGGSYAVNNSGTIAAAGGKILLNASVSADLFSEAVNHGGMNGSTDAIVHDDGSFTLGAANSVINSGTLDVSGTSSAAGNSDAGYVVVTGENIEHRGSILANAEGDALAGEVYLESNSATRMTSTSRIAANAESTSGTVSLSAYDGLAYSGAAVETSGNTYLTAYISARTPTIDTYNLHLSSIGSVRQAGAARVSGNTHLDGAFEADIRLSNTVNDFNSLSVDSEYTSYFAVTDSNDLALADIELSDSSLHVSLRGEGATVEQLPDSHINVNGSSLNMTAENIVLGAAGSSTSMYMGTMQLYFSNSIATNGSIELQPLDESIPANSARIVGRDYEFGDVYFVLRGDRAVDVNATIESESRMTLDAMTGAAATLQGIMMEVEQTGPITLSGGLNWNSHSANLDNPNNDIAFIQGNGGVDFGHLNYVDSNDLQIRNLVTTNEVIVRLASVGAGASLRQASNTVLAADFIELSADNIILGANGRSRIDGGYDLKIDFGNQLIINGPWQLKDYGGQGPFLTINGTDDANRLVIGEFATNSELFNDAGFWASAEINLGGGDDTATFNSEFLIDYDPELWNIATLDMGAGNDRVNFNNSVNIPLTLGLGNDIISLGNAAVQYEVVDFDAAEDQLITP